MFCSFHLVGTHEVDENEILDLIANPPVPGKVYSNAVTALARVAAERDDVGGEFVEPLERLLNRPSVKTEIALRALRHVASNDPESVAEVHEDVVSCVEIDADDHAVNRAATGCSVELAYADSGLLMEYTPLFGSLLDSEDETVRRNCVYVLTCVAKEHPEEVLPAVDDVISSLDRHGDPDGSKSSLVGRISRHYPDATVEAVPVLQDILEGSGKKNTKKKAKVKANALGALADIAKEHPDEVVDSLERAEELLEHQDGTVRYNTCGLIEEVSKQKPREVENLSPKLIGGLDDDHQGVRLKTAFVLGEIKADDAVERLKELKDGDPSIEVRRLAEKAVWRIEEDV
mgnify:CR=1 FL=1